jgi:integrase
MYPEPPEGFRVIARLENHPDDPPNLVRKYYALESPDGGAVAWDGMFFRRLPVDWKARCRWRAVPAKPITFNVAQDVEPEPRRARVWLVVLIGCCLLLASWLVCRSEPRAPRAIHSPVFPVRNDIAARILSVDEIGRLIRAARPWRNRVLLAFMYQSGARVSEVASVRWKDVRVDDRGRTSVHFFGKGRLNRWVALQPELIKEMRTLRCTGKPDEPVFTSNRRVAKRNRLVGVESFGPVKREQIHRIVRATARRAGINRPCSPHTLRHCFASHSLDGGCALHDVRNALGHSSIATTDIYLQVRGGVVCSDFLPRIALREDPERPECIDGDDAERELDGASKSAATG